MTRTRSGREGPDCTLPFPGQELITPSVPLVAHQAIVSMEPPARSAMVGCFWPIFSFADHIPRRVTLRPAIRVPRARKETPSKNGMPHSRAKTWI